MTRKTWLLPTFALCAFSLAISGCSASQTRPASTPTKATAAVEDESVISFGDAPVDGICGDAMFDAAVIGRSGGNTDQLILATQACAAPIFWVNAAREYPDALELADPTDEAIARSYYAICLAAKKSNAVGGCNSTEAAELFKALGERL